MHKVLFLSMSPEESAYKVVGSGVRSAHKVPSGHMVRSWMKKTPGIWITLPSSQGDTFLLSLDLRGTGPLVSGTCNSKGHVQQPCGVSKKLLTI